MLKGKSVIFAHVAQLVEHFLGKEEVTGSNPVAGSIMHDYHEFDVVLINFFYKEELYG